MVVYRMLGALEVAEGGVHADLGPPKQRALLAVLLLHPNEILPVDAVIDDLWGEGPPRQAQHAVQVYVSELRRALAPLAGEDVITWRSPGYLLAVDPEAIDARRFERLVADGLRRAARAGTGATPGAGAPAGTDVAADAAAAATLREALALWRGQPLVDVAYEEFAQPAIRRLEGIRLQAQEALARLELASGRDAEALGLAEAATAGDPLRESASELRMLALYRLGRHGDALRAYEELRRVLADEVGAEPSPVLRDLQERILLHDPSLHGVRRDGARAEAVEARNPYKGLRPFSEEDAGDFFGREELVARLDDALAGGTRLVALVGPSGSGKSSILHAGLIPRLRSRDGDGALPAVADLRPGAHPLEALDVALRTPGERLVVVVDQLEELFAAGEAEVAAFLATLVAAVQDPGRHVAAALALRADAYDQPLLHAGFAPVFLAGAVTVVPMTTAEIEDAIVRPARAAGVEVDPGLLAELVVATVDRPGALPLLQHTLAELFDRRADSALALEAYRALGGLESALARRAEAILTGLDEGRREVARQLLLRLVEPVDAGRPIVPRVPVRDLTALGLDPVVLSDVLVVLADGRLLTFDRDAVSGGATVEIAHEALLGAWGRLAGWIEEERADLARRAALARRASECVAAGRRPEDLLAGARLDEAAAWSRVTSLRLADDERAFLDQSLARRDEEVAAAAARAAALRRLERRARVRLAGLAAAVALLAVGAGWAVTAWPGPASDVALVYPGSGARVSDSIADGVELGVARHDLDAEVVVEVEGRLEDRLRRLAAQGVRLVVVGFPWANPPVERAARDNPGTRFLTADYHGELPNVSVPTFAFEEGAFLVGAAAALESRTRIVGILVEGDTDHDWPYPAGFEAGVRAVDPGIDVLVSYLPGGMVRSLPFGHVNAAAHALYRQGADVVFYAGQAAPLGAFEAAFAESRALGRHCWAVALDTDWYAVLPLVAQGSSGDGADWRPHVLTSLITHYDEAFATMLDAYAEGTLAAGERRFDLADGVFELAESGGFIEPSLPALAAFHERIVAGEIRVPALPDDRGPPR